MKMNAWLRFGLIVLCLAMAMSTFACGNGGNETTEKPDQPTTEAPTQAPTEEPTEEPTAEKTEEPTEKPTAEPTVEKTEEPTKEPTVEPTAEPTVEPTVEPTAEPTAEPTVEKTEEPTVEPTTEPVVEPTEEPTEETTEDPEAEIVEKIPLFFGKDELLDATVNDGLYMEPTKTGVLFVNDFNVDAHITLFKSRAAETPTGQYLFIKYRASENTEFTAYTATDSDGPVWNRAASVDIVTDENWHIAVVDVSKLFLFPAGEDGKYYVKHLRLDIEGAEGVWAEIEYMGYGDDISALAELFVAIDGEENAKAYVGCSTDGCPAGVLVGTAIDNNVHSPKCAICGATGESQPHTGATVAVWNAAEERYASVTPCTVCGAEGYTLPGNVIVDSNTIGTAGSWGTKYSKGLSDETCDSFISFSYDKGTTDASWCPVALTTKTDDDAVTGKYMILKYRIPADLEMAPFRIELQSLTSATRGIAVDFDDYIVDGEWHIIIVDLAATLGDAFGPNSDGTYSANSTVWINPSYTPMAAGSMDIAYWIYADDILNVDMSNFDNVDPESCVCPEGAQIVDLDGTTTCHICGKVSAYEIDYTGPVYRLLIGAIGDVGNQLANNKGFKYNRRDIMVDPHSATLRVDGWILTEQGIEKYMYRLIVDGEEQDWETWNHSGKSPDDLTAYVERNFSTWNARQAAYGARFNVVFTFDLKELHGKQVDLEFVAVTRDGISLSIFTAYNVTPEHGGVGDGIDNGDGTHGLICVGEGCDVVWGTEEHPVDYLELEEYVDNKTHKLVCTICNARIAEEHTASTYNGLFDSASSKYFASCTGCSGMTDVAMLGHSVVTGHDYGSAWGGYAQGGYGVSGDNGIMKITPNSPNENGGAVWGRVLFPNLADVMAKYCIVKYRIPTDAVPEGVTSIGKVNFELENRNSHNQTLVVGDDWNYVIIMMSETDPVRINVGEAAISWYHSSVHQNEDGTYSYDLSCLEIEYMAFADVLPDLAKGDCPCPDFALGELQDLGDGTHGQICSICGEKNNAENHTGSFLGTWDGAAEAYVKLCSVCNGKTNITTYGNIVFDAAYLSTIAIKSGGASITLSGDGTFVTVSETGYINPFIKANWGVTAGHATDYYTGNILVIKYKEPKDDLFTIYTSSSSGTTTAVRGEHKADLVLDQTDGWHYFIADLNQMLPGCWKPETIGDKTYYSMNYLRLDGFNADIAYIAVLDDVTKAPIDKELCPCPEFALGAEEDMGNGALGRKCSICGKMAHNCTDFAVDLEVCELVGGGVAMEYYAQCDYCGDKIARNMTNKTSWAVYSPGATVTNGQTLIGGWVMITGGTKNVEYVITDGTNTVTIVTDDITSYRNDIATSSGNKFAYMGPDRGYASFPELVINDWSNVNGVDFTGKNITIAVYAVSRADNLVKIRILSPRAAVVAAE